MPVSPTFRRRLTGLVAAGGLVAAMTAHAGPAQAADRDRDGMPNRWESRHGLNPSRDDAARDRDRDGLSNIAEYRRGSHPSDEDTDNDGHDDGDEVRDGYRSTRLLDRDSDDDGVRDGDEDADRDGRANEDEDDALEGCLRDDDDRDRDAVADEDENELRMRSGDADSDDDGTGDGAEDWDDDGESNEDEDDAPDDRCDGDRDDDGESDEDEDDFLGTVASFDPETGALVITTAAGERTFYVTEDTEIEIDHDEDDEGTTADLTPGRGVAEVEVDDETGDLEEIELVG